MPDKKSRQFIDSNLPDQVTQDQLAQTAQELITHELRNSLRQRFRTTSRAILHPLTLIIASLHFVLARHTAFSQTLGVLKRSGIWFLGPVSVTKQSFFERFTALSSDSFLWLINACSCALRQRANSFEQAHPVSQWAPFAEHTFALDDSTLDEIARFSFIRERPDPENPDTNEQLMNSLPGRIAALFNVGTGLLHRVEFHQDPDENEKAHARPIVLTMPVGSLLLCDLGYFSFPWFDWLTGHFTYFISRMRKGTSFVPIHTFVETPELRDRLIYLGKYRSDRAAYPVRFVEILVDGEWWGYITNVLEPSMLPGHYLFALYDQRWTIERCFAVLKEVLGLSRLRLCHIQGVLWQLWATIFGYQVAQLTRLEVASRLDVSPSEVSWEKFFQGFEAYYREAAGRAKEGSLDWLIKNYESLELIKKKRKSERKERTLPAGIESIYEVGYSRITEWPKPRKPRYAGRRCRENEDESGTVQRKKIVGRKARRKKKRSCKRRQKKRRRRRSPSVKTRN